jgi:CubicO group peptidase (beta-lactamase class C family)
LGFPVVMDSKKNAWMGPGSAGSFGWPGLFGGWWQVDPQRETVMLWLQQTMLPQALPGNSNAMGDSRMAEAFARWLFAHRKLLSLMSTMAQRFGKAPRMPGIAAVQGFQRETQAALTKLA